MIRSDPDQILHTECRPAKPDEAREAVALLERAIDWTADQGRPALGLAAPQIGLDIRVFIVVGYPAFVNPRLLRISTERSAELEECLSLPASMKVRVSRPKWAKFATQDEHGVTRTIKLHGASARAALHELDHLEGVMITDRGEPVPNTYQAMRAPRGQAA